MKILHRFYDLFVGGAEVVVLNTVRALPEHEHVLLFSRSTQNWVADALSQLPNVRMLQVEPGNGIQEVCKQRADLNCFHYYPPMSDSDFRDLPPQVLRSSLLINHWHQEVPEFPGLGYMFLSEASRRSTGANIPLARSAILINPVASSFFEVQRQEISNSVGRHSRDAGIKFSDDFFDICEGIQSQVQYLVLGAPPAMAKYVSANLSRLRQEYWLLPFGSMDVHSFLRRPQVYLYKTRDDMSETCPMNILEAMAAGVPIIAERKGGICSLIDDRQTGVLCEDVRDYTEAVDELLCDSQLRNTLRSQARDWVHENACQETYGQRFLDVATTLL